jgi:hypothetical protein
MDAAGRCRKSETRNPKSETNPNSLKWMNRNVGTAGFRRSLRTIPTIAVQRAQRGKAATEWKTDRIMAGQNHAEQNQNHG